MTTPFLCVLAAFVLAWAMRLPVFVAIKRSGRELDIANPELQMNALEGLGARAVAAHRSALQNFAPFAAAVVVAHLAGADPRRTSVLAITFVVAQLVHGLAYLADVDYLRSFVWLIAWFATLGLFLLAL